MLTEFGKILRKLRIDHDETLIRMAKKLQVTASFLSYVETGQRNVPDVWLEQIPRLYSLNTQQSKELREAGLIRLKSVKMDVEQKSEEDKTLALLFARRLAELSSEEKDQIFNILSQKEK